MTLGQSLANPRRPLSGVQLPGTFVTLGKVPDSLLMCQLTDEVGPLGPDLYVLAVPELVVLHE